MNVADEVRSFPHMTINLADRTIDLDAAVVTRESDWIELLACSPESREYESILVTEARPSHIHLSLLMLGIEPGRPLSWRQTDTGYEILPPAGDPVIVSLLLPESGVKREIPAGNWIVNQQTGEMMTPSNWLFTGSAFADQADARVYKADLNGTVISLVNFGDDLLARPNRLMNHNDNQAWQANTAAIPPLGTEVTIRLRPAKPEPPDRDANNPSP